MQPKIYTVDEHGISPDKIDSHAFYVIEKLRQAGYSAYLVGGGVRDLLLNQKPKDFDISTSAQPEEIRALFRNAILIGRRFRLAHIRFGKKIIEVSTFRSGDTEAADLIVRDNQWGNEEQDVLRRDFTINGLFYDPEHQTVIDYVDGYQDVGKRILRTIGQPDLRFIQDPVRMIRLIKFCARFHFEIDGPTHEALLNCKDEIVKSSPARILEELLRMLESGASKPFFYLLNQYGLLRLLLPSLSKYLDQDSHQLIMQLLSEIDAEIPKHSQPIDRSMLLSALLFPLLHSHLHMRVQETNRMPHLGLICQEAETVIDRVFAPFFQLPRRMRGCMSFILASQYRFVPLDGRLRKPKPTKDPLFPLALHLFKIRCALEPDLLSHYTLWTEASFASHEESDDELTSQEPEPQKRRRRRRYRRS